MMIIFLFFAVAEAKYPCNDDTMMNHQDSVSGEGARMSWYLSFSAQQFPTCLAGLSQLDNAIQRNQNAFDHALYYYKEDQAKSKAYFDNMDFTYSFCVDKIACLKGKAGSYWGFLVGECQNMNNQFTGVLACYDKNVLKTNASKKTNSQQITVPFTGSEKMKVPHPDGTVCDICVSAVKGLISTAAGGACGAACAATGCEPCVPYCAGICGSIAGGETNATAVCQDVHLC
jgi:hypothetical protein